MITIEQAKNLKQGEILYHVSNKNKDGSAQRWKVTSVKTWKRTPGKVRIGLKYGMYTYDSMTENELDLVNLSDDPFIRKVREIIKEEKINNG